MNGKANCETHIDKILAAVTEIVRIEGKREFSRNDIRIRLGLSRAQWEAGYTSIFQAMRCDQPGGAPQIPAEYRNVFQRISHGIYKPTDYGKSQIDKYAEKARILTARNSND